MRHRRLQKSLESLGCVLLRGTWAEMARAAFRVKELRAELIKCALRQVSIECTTIQRHLQYWEIQQLTASGVYLCKTFVMNSSSKHLYCILFWWQLPHHPNEINNEKQKKIHCQQVEKLKSMHHIVTGYLVLLLLDQFYLSRDLVRWMLCSLCSWCLSSILAFKYVFYLA